MHRTLNSSHPLRYSPFNAKTVFNQSLLVRMRLVFPIVSALAWLIHQLVQPTLPKPSYSPAVNPAAILNPNAPPRPPKSFLDAVAGSAAPWVPVKPVLLHRGEPIAHFLPRKCRLWLNLSNWHLLVSFVLAIPPQKLLHHSLCPWGWKGTPKSLCLMIGMCC